MMKSIVLVLALLVCTPAAFSQIPTDWEEAGLDNPATSLSQIHKTVDERVIQQMLRGRGFLMIPDSTSDTVGMFDPNTGDYLGDIINGSGLFSTPINAVLGPDGNIYVSDQVADSVFVYDIGGAYLSTFADASDGLNNIRGIDFRGQSLFVTSGDDYVAEFTAPHTRVVPDFIADGSDPFDILFLSNGESLLTDIAGDAMRHYDAGGVLINSFVSVDFPEQVQFDSLAPGDYITAVFTGKQVVDFELNGTVVETTPAPSSSRGTWRLPNGNLLVTDGSGVHEIVPGTGAVVSTKYSGSCRFIESTDQVSKPSVDIKCNGGDSAVQVPSGTNAKLDVSVVAGPAAGTPVDVWIALITPFGPFTYNGTGPIAGWNMGFGFAYFTGPLAGVNITALDRPVPLGSYKGHVGLDLVPNGSLDLGSIALRDMVDFTVF